MSLLEFADGDVELAGRAALLGAIVQGIGPAAVGIVSGVGLVKGWDGHLHPMLMTTLGGDASAWQLIAISDAPIVSKLFEEAFERFPDWFSDVVVFETPDPEPYLSPGDWITAPNAGRVGCQVSWQGGAGFLTAGHVAPAVGAGVFDTSTRLGTVQFASNPAGGGLSPMADVSIVELTSTAIFAPPLGARVPAAANSAISVLSGSRAVAGTVFAFCIFSYWKKIRGTYGDTYITSSSVSSGGDSGSAVVDGYNNVVGLLVGGSAANSFIQDVKYQIAQASGPSAGGLSGLTI